MKFLKAIILLTGILALNTNTFAQSYAETAYLISRTNPGGTARIQSLGGAQTALGGDISLALSNPAGLGMYNRSEVTISPMFLSYNYNNEFLGGRFDDTHNNFTFGSIGVALHSPSYRNSDFVGGTFAITFTRTNDFNQHYTFGGLNTATSIIDSFIELANGAPESQFNQGSPNYNTLTGLAYYNYLIGPETVIDPDLDPTLYFTDILGIPFQTETASITGSSNQWSISYGGNYKDMLYFGAGIGVTSLRYRSEKTYREAFEDEPIDDLVINERLDLSGSGINFNLGMIVRPVDIVQLGISYTTRTYYNIEDLYEASMRTSWKNFEYLPGEILGNESASTGILVSEYNLNTPSRLSAGATVFLDKFGFITASIERVNYGGARFRSNFFGVSFEGDNQEIQQTFGAVNNLRFGAEGRADKFRFRAGYAFLPDPLRLQGNFNRNTNLYSVGAGIKQKNFAIDLAYVLQEMNNTYRPYLLADGSAPVSVQKFNTNNFMLTVGFNF
ncbi:MAG TPA: long-chain fatty acid transporter [Cyclobacteriaceae bacterium]|nr:long-chain fatty acid transporter [Cyclobacteriaceae bacterium]